MLRRDEVGLGESEQAFREREVIEATRLVEIKQAQGNLDKESLADLKAKLATSALVRRELEAGIVGAAFAGATQGLAGSLSQLLDQTTTVSQAFRNMALSIRDSILENIVKRGIKVAQDALEKWLQELDAVGLLQGLGGSLSGLFSSSATGQAGGIGTSDITRAQHGGIVRRPTLLLAGEAGPEAIVPLGAGGAAGPAVVVNVFPPAGTETEQRERQGPNGQVIKDIVIRAVRLASQTGELDSIMGTYGIRRPAIAR
jgi:hypothetical protein